MVTGAQLSTVRTYTKYSSFYYLESLLYAVHTYCTLVATVDSDRLLQLRMECVQCAKPSHVSTWGAGKPHSLWNLD